MALHLSGVEGRRPWKPCASEGAQRRAATPRCDGAGPAVGPGSSPLGHKLRPKEGYFPVPPADALQDVRTSMVTLLERIGVAVRLLRGFRRRARVARLRFDCFRDGQGCHEHRYSAYVGGRVVSFKKKVAVRLIIRELVSARG